jgi:hypothetical protein
MTESIVENIESSSQGVKILNPLTGLSGYNADAVGKRPVAVMVNNIKASLPQYGIEKADIIYELPVEGGITRLMAVYADYTNVPNVCSIRSCRYYYPIIAFGMDAIYCHWGEDKTIAVDTLNRLKIDNIDGYSNGYDLIFFRDKQRAKTYDTEHTGYLKGSELPKAIQKLGYRNNIKTDLLKMFTFNQEDNPVLPEGNECVYVNVPFSDDYYSTFKYDTVTKTYKKEHSGKKHMDSATGNQLSFTNVFVLESNISSRGTKNGLINVELKGGKGYYISDGMAQPITWKKAAEDEPIKFYDKAGSELRVNAGKSYIGILDKTAEIKIK